MLVTSETVVNTLISHNIKPSYPRIKIFEYLVKWENHPTVEEIYLHLVKEIPTLSKTTVYNTLDLLVQSNLARLLSIEDHEARYDADVSSHGHFKCIRCGRINDFCLDAAALQCSSLAGYSVYEHHFYVKGLCPECLA